MPYIGMQKLIINTWKTRIIVLHVLGCQQSFSSHKMSLQMVPNGKSTSLIFTKTSYEAMMKTAAKDTYFKLMLAVLRISRKHMVIWYWEKIRFLHPCYQIIRHILKNVQKVSVYFKEIKWLKWRWLTGAIRSSSREKRYQELRFESLQQRH